MTKPISTRTHGLLDYMTAGLFFALPRVLGWDRKATRLLDVAGGGTVLYSLMTRYERGAAPVLPMKVHLALDVVSGAALVGAAAVMDEHCALRATLATLGAWQVSAALLTEPESQTETDDRTGTGLPGRVATESGQPLMAGGNI